MTTGARLAAGPHRMCCSIGARALPSQPAIVDTAAKCDTMPAAQLSERARMGFARADRYDRHRPSYPTEAVSALLSAAEVADFEHATIIDLAAGTGKLTETLASREERFNVLAVEPHDGMRQQLLQNQLPNVKIVEGLSTAIPAENGSAEAVFVAQAFHWFANEASIKEIHRVLKPVGILGLIWNAEDYNTPLSFPTTSEWAATLRSHIHQVAARSTDHEPRFRDDSWRTVFEQQTSKTPLTAALVTGSNSLFSLPLGEKRVPWQVWLEKEELWARIQTLSHFAVLEGEELDEFRKTFDEVLNKEDVERDADGQIRVDGVTLVAWTTKIPA